MPVLTGQVFVSHTSDMAVFPQGRSFVRAALDGVVRAGMAPVDMAYFAARDEQPADYCRERVRQCEVYLAVVGLRYGSVVPGEAISYTELEFAEAGAAGLPRLVFLLDENATGSADADRGAVDRFRERLQGAGLVTSNFSTADGLELAVYQALTERAGGGRAGHVRFSLPPDTAAFTGRGEELGAITAAVTGAAGGGGVVAVRAIDGMPGVGKTALAVHAAHALAGRFPDRQLFIDLHAHTPGQDPVRPEDALAGLLTATGADPRFLPGDLEGRAGMWRDRMAGQRALLVLDNAASSGQVIPLLPGGGDCLVLVTSRRHLGDLPGLVVPVLLDALPAGQAQEMFTRLAPRAAADPAGVAEVVRLAGSLPLAVSLLARVLARHPSWTLADLAAETRDGLLALAAEHQSVAAAFEVSYRYLDPARQRLFRLLGLHLGATTDAYAAAALAGTGLEEAAGLLDGLHAEGLLTEAGYRRYGMHDLLRRYARDHAAHDEPTVEREQALGRLLDYYQHAAALAQACLARQARPGPPLAAPAGSLVVPVLGDAGQALAWARADRDNLLACLDYAAEHDDHARVIALTAGITALMRRDGPWADAIARHAAVVRAAQRLGDRLSEASALSELGIVRRLTGDHEGAASALGTALGLYRDLGERLGEADALYDLGLVWRMKADFPRAVESLEQSLAIYRKLGDRQGQANALNHLGIVRRLTGDARSAGLALAETLDIYRGLGDRQGQVTVLNSLGALQCQSAEFAAAVGTLSEALFASREVGDRLGQLNALVSLGRVLQQTGDYPGAMRVLDEALRLSRKIGSRLGQAFSLCLLGLVDRLTGDLLGAEQALEESLDIACQVGSGTAQANALCNIGSLRRVTGDHEAAAQALDQALAIYRSVSDQAGEIEALNEMGALHRAADDVAGAETCHQRALDLAHQIASDLDEGHALAGLGRCDLAAGRTAQARARLRQALDIYQRLGSAETTGVSAEIDGLGLAAPGQSGS